MVCDSAIGSRNIHVRFQSCLKESYVASFNIVARQTGPCHVMHVKNKCADFYQIT